VEWLDFAAAIHDERPALTTPEDGLASARLMDADYSSSRQGAVVRLAEAAAR
jgi:predicted dehydrogenase